MFDNLPPGCTDSDLPGCSKSDMAFDIASEKQECIVCIHYLEDSCEFCKKKHQFAEIDDVELFMERARFERDCAES